MFSDVCPMFEQKQKPFEFDCSKAQSNKHSALFKANQDLQLQQANSSDVVTFRLLRWHHCTEDDNNLFKQKGKRHATFDQKQRFFSLNPTHTAERPLPRAVLLDSSVF